MGKEDNLNTKTQFIILTEEIKLGGNITKGSTWRVWDFHLHTPYSILNNGYGDPSSEDTWKNYIDKIEEVAKSKNIAAIGITDYFMIEGYKKIKEYKEKGRLENVFIFPNVEFRIDKVIAVNKSGKNENIRLNLHVIFSPEINIKDIEESFLHELDFIYEQAPFTPEEKSKLKIHRLEELGKKLKSEHPTFCSKSDLYIGCMNAVVNPSQIKSVLEEKQSIFKGKYLIILAEEKLSLLEWDSQAHVTRKQLLQMSHCIFSSNKNTKDFCLGKKHQSIKQYLKEFKSFKPCIWGCDGHSFEERFLEPDKNGDDKTNYCWIKSEVSWDGLKQILYEPDERLKIQDNSPEPQKSIYAIDKLEIKATDINESLRFNDTKIDLNHNLITIIGGRGSGKTAILDIIGSCFKEGIKLNKIENSFYYRLYGEKGKDNKPIPVQLRSISGETFIKNIGEEDTYFELSDVLYITQRHFEEFSGNYKRLGEHVFKLIFEKVPDEKNKYENYQNKLKNKIIEIQNINLKIQQLSEEIRIRTELEIALKQKEGEKLDYEKRIQEIETKANVSKEVNELADKLNKSRNKKQEIESLLYRIDSYPTKINGFKEFATTLEDLNHDFNLVFKEEADKLSLFPGKDLLELLSNIEMIANKNKQTMEELLPSITSITIPK